MSVTATNWAYDKASEISMSHPARAVFYALAHCHNQSTGKCFPSAEKLSKLAGYSIRSIRSAIKELCKIGLIKVFQRKRKEGGQWKQDSNSFTFCTKALKKPTKAEANSAELQGAIYDISSVQGLHPNIEDTPNVPSDEKPAPSKPYDLAIVEEGNGTVEAVEPSHPEISFDEFVRRVAPPIEVYDCEQVQGNPNPWIGNNQPSVADRYLRNSFDRLADQPQVWRAA